MRSRAALRRIATVVLIAAAGYYLTRAIGSNWSELEGFSWRVAWVPLLVSVPLHILVLTWGVWVWGRVLAQLGQVEVGQLVLAKIWFVSNLARYIPGKVFQFVAAAQLSRASGLSAPVMLTSLIVNTCLSLLTAGAIGAWTLSTGIAWLAPAATVAVLLVVHPRVINAVLGAVPRILHREVIRWNGGWLDGVGLLALAAVGWFGYGVAYHMLVWALADVPWGLFPQMVGVNCLSFFLGFASLLPGGLGVREVAMTELLNPYLPAGVGAVLALASRLWTIVAEVLGGAIAAVFAARTGGTASNASHGAER